MSGAWFPTMTSPVRNLRADHSVRLLSTEPPSHPHVHTCRDVHHYAEGLPFFDWQLTWYASLSVIMGRADFFVPPFWLVWFQLRKEPGIRVCFPIFGRKKAFTTLPSSPFIKGTGELPQRSWSHFWEAPLSKQLCWLKLMLSLEAADNALNCVLICGEFPKWLSPWVALIIVCVHPLIRNWRRKKSRFLKSTWR